MSGMQFSYEPTWHESQVGEQIVSAMQQQLETILPTIFGFYILQIGRHDYSSWLNTSPIQEKILLSDEPSLKHTPYPLVLSSFNELPFAENSIDAIYLPCLLERLEHPQVLLEELWRILLPSGTLILHGFNPWSALGLKHLLPHPHQSFPCEGRYHSLSTVKKWLSLSNFSIEGHDFFYHPPSLPKSPSHFLEKIKAHCYYPFGGLYQLIATKHVTPATLLKPRWSIKLIDQPLVAPNPQARSR